MHLFIIFVKHLLFVESYTSIMILTSVSNNVLFIVMFYSLIMYECLRPQKAPHLCSVLFHSSSLKSFLNILLESVVPSILFTFKGAPACKKLMLLAMKRSNQSSFNLLTNKYANEHQHMLLAITVIEQSICTSVNFWKMTKCYRNCNCIS